MWIMALDASRLLGRIWRCGLELSLVQRLVLRGICSRRDRMANFGVLGGHIKFGSDSGRREHACRGDSIASGRVSHHAVNGTCSSGTRTGVTIETNLVTCTAQQPVGSRSIMICVTVHACVLIESRI